MTSRVRWRVFVVALALSLLGNWTVSRPAWGGGRIVNGVPTQDRPTTGALLMSFDGFLSGICSGTLVGCQHFVTAAHCVCVGDNFATCGTPDPAHLRVYLQHAGVLGVSAVAVHPSFAFGSAGDVAVLRLTTPVTGIQPTGLNTLGNPSAGTAGTIAGFGITGGPSNDFGILREGAITLSSCGGVVPEPAHTCWTFDGAIGVPGADSNSCTGDSGGSLLAKIGGEESLLGVTSGGISPDCLPHDISFASSAFQNRAFIESVAGADLSPNACGSMAPLDTAGTHVTARSFNGMSKSELACRRFVAREYTTYAFARLRHMQKCLNAVNAGVSAGPCPDAVTFARIAKAEQKLIATLARSCAPEVIPTIGVAGTCSGAPDLGALQGCVAAAAIAAADVLLDTEYADPTPSGAIADLGLRACQLSIAKAASRYGNYRLRVLTRCQTSADRGTIGTCPSAAMQAKIAAYAGKVLAGIDGGCSDDQVAQLSDRAGFGGACGGARSVTALASCETAQQDAETNALFGLLGPVAWRRYATVNVPAGTARLRMALNGIDTGVTDLDVYARRGGAPTAAVFDARSINGGVYESIDVGSPAAGTWHVVASPVAGRNVPYQLTITTFGP